MEIKGKVWCMFEQSGTFKNEFIKLGIDAVDLDIQNKFGETDHVIDLFAEIEKGYDGKPSIFDEISKDDLIVAFFPCIYFETMSMMYFDLSTGNNKNKPKYERIGDAIERLDKRTFFHKLIYKLVAICSMNAIRLIIENPATQPHYLVGTQNFFKPSLIDPNRQTRGDWFKKPTAYWFFDCEPSNGFTKQDPEMKKNILKSKSGLKAGLCSEERSLISPDYARNFICDFILGKSQPNICKTLFD